ncbi:MAG: hypothetical protein LBS02_02175 [Hungatella sp.]|jgi:hypothetical protein|nr:hypothetical protein [Hungatella sp.]
MDIPLLNFINEFGIITCNKDNFLKSINDIGSSWQDAVVLINEREIFYSKIYKKKTVYISKYLYCLLKKIGNYKSISENASSIYKILESNPPQNTEMLKIVSGLNKDEFNKAQMELLEKLHITAFSSYKSININWSSFLYTTSFKWEQCTKLYDINYTKEKAKKEVFLLLEKTMRKTDIENILRNIS